MSPDPQRHGVPGPRLAEQTNHYQTDIETDRQGEAIEAAHPTMVSPSKAAALIRVF